MKYRRLIRIEEDGYVMAEIDHETLIAEFVFYSVPDLPVSRATLHGYCGA